jgi:hypothetical protein
MECELLRVLTSEWRFMACSRILFYFLSIKTIFKDLSIILKPFAVRAMYECLSPFSKMETDMWFDPLVWLNPFLNMVENKQKYVFVNKHDDGEFLS